MNNSLLVTSVWDTTPLQRLESQSTCSEPTTPTLHGSNGTDTTPLSASSAESSPGLKSAAATASVASTLSLTNQQQSHQHQQHNSNSNNNNNNNNNSSGKIELCLNNFVSGEKRQMELNGTRTIFCRIILDIIIVSCVGLPVLAFRLYGVPYKRGFFCDDASLKHPDRESSVHSWMLVLIGFIIPISVIIAVEFFKSNYNQMRGFGHLSPHRYYICLLKIPDWIIECYKRIGLLVFGAGVGELTTDIAKYTIGRLRPHFIAVCQPIMHNGTSCDHASNRGRYIENFYCSKHEASSRIIKDLSLSFPSSHACFTFFSMVYIAIYLQRRMTWRRWKMFRHLLQFLFLMFAWYTALTRVSDYKHHWTDVLAGSIIGTLYAVVVTFSLS